MIFLHSLFTGDQKIILTKSDENFLYLSKVKRYAVGEKILLGNIDTEKLCEYFFTEISKKEIILTKGEEILQKKSEEKREEKKNFHLAWGICDPKIITKTLPFLNEMGVSHLTFLECDRSQGNFCKEVRSEKFSQKIQKILENSCQQSGRLSRLHIKNDTLQSFFKKNPETIICDFPAEKNFSQLTIFPEKLCIGPEGGFSLEEKSFFQKKFPENIFQFSGNIVLRSETAVIGIAGKYLL